MLLILQKLPFFDLAGVDREPDFLEMVLFIMKSIVSYPGLLQRTVIKRLLNSYMHCMFVSGFVQQSLNIAAS